MDTNTIIFDIELTNFCNNHCIMCPRHSLKRPLGKMRTEVFHKIIEDIETINEQWNVNYIGFTGFGECLLHPSIAIFIRSIKERMNTKVGITTNGLLLTKTNIARLVSTGLDEIHVSIHGINEVYNKISHRMDFSYILENMHNLIRLSRGKVHVTALAVENSINRQQLKSGEFYRYWKNLGVDSVDIIHCHSRGGNFRDTSIFDFNSQIPEKCKIFLPFQFITWDGDFLACCNDLDASTCLGNIKTHSISDILKKKHEIGNPRNHFLLCTKCPDNFVDINP